MIGGAFTFIFGTCAGAPPGTYVRGFAFGDLFLVLDKENAGNGTSGKKKDTQDTEDDFFTVGGTGAGGGDNAGLAGWRWRRSWILVVWGRLVHIR